MEDLPHAPQEAAKRPDTSVEKLVEYRTAHYSARSEAARYVTNTPAQVRFQFANPVLCILRSGEKQVRIGAAPRFVLRPDEVLYVPSGLSFEIDLGSATPEAPIICDCLEVEASHLEALLARFNAYGAKGNEGRIAAFNWGAHLHLPPAQAKTLALDAIFALFRAPRDLFSDLLIETSIDLALLRLLQMRAETMIEIRESADSGGLSVALRMIDDNLDQHLSNQALAEKLGLSESTLQRRFLDVLGTSPSRYANRRRVQEAKRYLRETAIPLKEIAFKLGFSDVSHMSRIFRASTGEPPAAYRIRQKRRQQSPM